MWGVSRQPRRAYSRHRLASLIGIFLQADNRLKTTTNTIGLGVKNGRPGHGGVVGDPRVTKVMGFLKSISRFVVFVTSIYQTTQKSRHFGHLKMSYLISF